MLMLTSYLDETGDSKDEKQKFNGMAGLVGPAENWEEFEWRWKKILKQSNLPHFHMSEMKIPSICFQPNRILRERL